MHRYSSYLQVNKQGGTRPGPHVDLPFTPSYPAFWVYEFKISFIPPIELFHFFIYHLLYSDVGGGAAYVHFFGNKTRRHEGGHGDGELVLVLAETTLLYTGWKWKYNSAEAGLFDLVCRWDETLWDILIIRLESIIVHIHPFIRLVNHRSHTTSRESTYRKG
jgi:hypothetical protein